MTCGACARSILVDAHAVGLWQERLAFIRENERYENVVFASFEIIPLYSPNQAVREIYENYLYEAFR